VERNELSVITQVPSRILPWYHEHKRDLPWRIDRDPYHVWLSEIMLQQTRVEAVKGYYQRFLSVCPSIQSLADADDDLLHKLWEGLGYYSRVRNLKRAAIEIMEKHNGVFPQAYDAVRALPGIGDYTAGAVCSIAFNMPTPAVDGNVLRIMSRLLDDHTPVDSASYKARTAEMLRAVYPRDAGAFTQALMELGATVCGPNRPPDCRHCPCCDICLGSQSGRAVQLPIKQPKRGRRIEKHTVLILHCDGSFALHKRVNKGLLSGLWEFPNIPGWFEIDELAAVLEERSINIREIVVQVERKHVFTHVEWHMHGVYINVSSVSPDYEWMTADAINKYAALPTAFRIFWEELNDGAIVL